MEQELMGDQICFSRIDLNLCSNVGIMLSFNLAMTESLLLENLNECLNDCH